MKRLLFLILLFAGHLYSQKSTKYTNEFLSVGVGARSHGMSNAVISSVSDASASYWNPARLVSMQGNRELFLMHSEYFAGIAKYDYAAIGAKIDTSSALAISFIRFGVDNIPNTTDLIDNQGNIDYNKITSFSASDVAFLLSFGKKLPIKGLTAGGNAKIIRRKIGDFANAWGLGIDLASCYENKNWLLGMMVRDASTTFNIWNFNLTDRMKEVFVLTGNEIPKSSTIITRPKLIIGVARKINLSKEIILLPELDMDFSFDRKRNVLVSSNFASIDPHLGVELSYKKLVYIRGGIGNIQKETNLVNTKSTTFQTNVGLGININNIIAIDYARTDFGDNSLALYSNIFSIRFSFYQKSNQNK